MSDRISLARDFEAQLRAFERRIKEKRAYAGMQLWALVFRNVQKNYADRDAEVKQRLIELRDYLSGVGLSPQVVELESLLEVLEMGKDLEDEG